MELRSEYVKATWCFENLELVCFDFLEPKPCLNQHAGSTATQKVPCLQERLRPTVLFGVQERRVQTPIAYENLARKRYRNPPAWNLGPIHSWLHKSELPNVAKNGLANLGCPDWDSGTQNSPQYPLPLCRPPYPSHFSRMSLDDCISVSV